MGEPSISCHETPTQEQMNEDLGTTYELSPLIKQPGLKVFTIQHGTQRLCGEGTYVLCDQGLVPGLSCVAERREEVVLAFLFRHRFVQTIVTPSGIGIMSSHIV